LRVGEPQRRPVEDELAAHAVRLARRNAALEDFATLVAHELKAPLHAALLGASPLVAVEEALDLVDSILEAVRAEEAADPCCIPSAALVRALCDLGSVGAVVDAHDLPVRFPLPGAALGLVLRNLVANALAADARRIEVSGRLSPGKAMVAVADDGVGLDAPAGYASGSGLGLGLMRRLVGRFDGTIELAPAPVGGTCAILTVPWR
jgi:signal transduction histidine kinase